MSRAGQVLQDGLHQGECGVRRHETELRGNREHSGAFFLHVGEIAEHVRVYFDLVHMGKEFGFKLMAVQVALEFCADKVHGVLKFLGIAAARTWLRELLRGRLFVLVLASHDLQWVCCDLQRAL